MARLVLVLFEWVFVPVLAIAFARSYTPLNHYSGHPKSAKTFCRNPTRSQAPQSTQAPRFARLWAVACARARIAQPAELCGSRLGSAMGPVG